jgi:hypothetical protein
MGYMIKCNFLLSIPWYMSPLCQFWQSNIIIAKQHFLSLLLWARARIYKSFQFQEPRNRIPAWRAGTTTLFDVPARQARHRLAKSIPCNLGSLNVYQFGLCIKIIKMRTQINLHIKLTIIHAVFYHQTKNK